MYVYAMHAHIMRTKKNESSPVSMCRVGVHSDFPCIISLINILFCFILYFLEIKLLSFSFNKNKETISKYYEKKKENTSCEYKENIFTILRKIWNECFWLENFNWITKWNESVSLTEYNAKEIFENKIKHFRRYLPTFI